MATTIEDILQTVHQHLPTVNHDRVKEAFELAKIAHEGQVRYSGDPYISHPLEAAALLLPLKPDEDTIIATLLHDVDSTTSVKMTQIESQFGASVARLIQGTQKLNLVKVQSGQSQVESWRKMFLAMAKDIRVIFIKLAERLHNMQTLEYVAEAKRLRIAQETLQIYAPIASRLGIYSMKSQLEDLSFKFLYPLDYARLQQQVAEHGRLNRQYIDRIQSVLEGVLAEEEIEAEVSGRIKHLYSIHRKLQLKGANSLRDVYDLFAIRIVLPDQHREDREFLGHLYTALGAIHNRWTPLSGRFKDYIAVPKLNGYRSLHTTIVGVLEEAPNQPIEIQIRTQSMHQESEYGIASHWWYKDSNTASTRLSREEMEQVLQERRLLAKFYDLLAQFPEKRAQFENEISRTKFTEPLRVFLFDHEFSAKDINSLHRALNSSTKEGRTKFFQHQIDWVYGLEFLKNELSTSSSDSNEVNIFQDRIFVLTPEGDVKDLPMGATPVDFAYAVHTDVGHRCVQAKVNGNIVRLDHELKSGDIVEILTRKDPQPNQYWLSFAKTSQAQNRIKNWFRTFDRDKNIKAGRDLLNENLKRLNKPPLGPNYRALTHYDGKKLSFGERENIVESVGDGTLAVSVVIRTMFSEPELLGARLKRRVIHTPKIVELVPTKEIKESDVLVTGESKIPITLSACCKPKFPVDIVGSVTRGQTIRIHRTDCKQLSDIEPERLLDASWAAKKSESDYQVRLQIEAEDRVGLLRDIITVVADLGVNIADIPLVSKKRGLVVRNLIVELSSYDSLTKLMYRLENTLGVRSVTKL